MSEVDDMGNINPGGKKRYEPIPDPVEKKEEGKKEILTLIMGKGGELEVRSPLIHDKIAMFGFLEMARQVMINFYGRKKQ